MIKIGVFALIAQGALSLYAASPEEVCVKKIYDHLLIADKRAALEEAEKALELYPQSRSLRAAYIQALAEHGDEMHAWEQWTAYQEGASKEPEHPLLEAMAWGALYQGSRSSQWMVRLHALLGATFTQEARAIPMLMAQLRGSNAMLRSLAVKLAASYGDAVLQEEIIRLFREEKVWYVRLEVIHAIGRLRITALKENLKDIILEKSGVGTKHPKAIAEEKSAAMIALVHMSDTLEDQELVSLMTSPRAGLRQLACEWMAHVASRPEGRYSRRWDVLPLLQDASPDVRIAALNAYTLMHGGYGAKKRGVEAILAHVESSMPLVAITAARCALVMDSPVGEQFLEKWLNQGQVEYVRLASAAIAASGRYGVRLAKKYLGISDPYARANLALGLIGQQVEVARCCDILYGVLQSEKGVLWMWEETGIFRSLAPSTVSHIEAIPHYPVVVDQMTRLELLSVLSMMRFHHAKEAVRSFLATRAWGVTGAAAATLLQEGDEGDLSAVRALLEDGNQHVRVQAALILAMVGEDAAAVPVLQAAYAQVDRETKVHILEALAHIGHAESIPFLIEILKEPFQILRVVAAAALLRCLSS